MPSRKPKEVRVIPGTIIKLKDGRMLELKRWKPYELTGTESLEQISAMHGPIHGFTPVEGAVEQQQSPPPPKTTGPNLAPPPKALEGILWLLLPHKHREAFLGDAEEAYWQTLAKFGSRWMASYEYCKEATSGIRVGVAVLVGALLLKLFKSSGN